MDEQGRKPWRRNAQFGRKWPESKSPFPAVAYPKDTKFTVKQIAYLHAYNGKDPRDIVACYPKTLTLAQVHLALFHYFSNREPVDAEIAAEIRFNRGATLGGASMSLPTMRPAPPGVADENGDS